jgi:hypothetical protein
MANSEGQNMSEPNQQIKSIVQKGDVEYFMRINSIWYSQTLCVRSFFLTCLQSVASLSRF